MEITEVRIKLMEDSDDRLQAFCSVTFDDSFVVRDLKIIDSSNGPFVAMPSRKLATHCSQCGCKNHLRASYCNQCGVRLKEDRGTRFSDGRAKLYADIAHPINSRCREMIQRRVIEEFEFELDRAEEPDYVSCYDDVYGEVDNGQQVRSEESSPTAQSPEAPTKQIQPAESEPRAPHTAPGKKRASTVNHPGVAEDDRENNGFGAGIF